MLPEYIWSSKELAMLAQKLDRALQVLEGTGDDGKITLAVMTERLAILDKRVIESCESVEALAEKVGKNTNRLLLLEERSGVWGKIQAALTLIVTAVAGWLALSK